jgi:hypothetical protein
MTQLLEQVITELHKLSAADQDAIAQIILDEIADDQQWDQAFARSQDALARLAARVRQDIQAGKVLITSFASNSSSSSSERPA